MNLKILDAAEAGMIGVNDVLNIVPVSRGDINICKAHDILVIHMKSLPKP